MTKTLYILGAGGHGKVVADAANKLNRWDKIFFLDDQKKGQQILNLTVINGISQAINYKNINTEFIVAIGDNATRKKVQTQLEDNDCELATVIHPSAIIGLDVNIGKGTVIFAGVVVNPSVKIGDGCIVNTASTIDHDSVLEDYVHLSPGTNISGSVRIGDKAWLGTNTTVINNVSINDSVIIGAGSLIIQDVIETGTYVGSPIYRLE